MLIDAEAEIDGYPLTWCRRVDHLPVEPTSSDADGLLQSAQKAGAEIRGESLRQLPLLAYYGTQRLWPTDIKADQSRKPTSAGICGRISIGPSMHSTTSPAALSR